MLRDTRLGKWVRKHDTLHRMVHASWCRLIGPLDHKRVATTSGQTIGPPPPPPPPPPSQGNYSVWLMTINPNWLLSGTPPQYITIAPLKTSLANTGDAIAWAKANVPAGEIYGVMDGTGAIVDTGTGTTMSSGSQTNLPAPYSGLSPGYISYITGIYNSGQPAAILQLNGNIGGPAPGVPRYATAALYLAAKANGEF